MRVPLLAANWKMNKTVGETLEYAGVFVGLIEDMGDSLQAEVLICPPFTSLPALCSVLSHGAIQVGSQNVFWEPKGPFTGEISPPMIKDLGCSYAIVGHSERRHVLGETDDMVRQKVRAVLDADLRPILCVGETLEEREAGSAFSVCDVMVQEGLKDVKGEEIPKVVIAYEPVWAIGTGREANPDDAEEVIAHIRATINRLFGDVSQEVRILYGGSVKSSNIRGFMTRQTIDGALVGGAGLDPVEFARIVQEALKAKAGRSGYPRRKGR